VCDRAGLSRVPLRNPSCCHTRSASPFNSDSLGGSHFGNCKCVWSSSHFLVWEMTNTVNLQKQDSYSVRWKEYRTRRLLAILFAIAFLVAPPLIGKVLGNGRSSQEVVGILLVTLLILTVVQGWRVAIWPCPKCGKAFRGTAPFPKSCRHCGLPIWSVGSTEAVDQTIP